MSNVKLSCFSFGLHIVTDTPQHLRQLAGMSSEEQTCQRWSNQENGKQVFECVFVDAMSEEQSVTFT